MPRKLRTIRIQRLKWKPSLKKTQVHYLCNWQYCSKKELLNEYSLRIRKGVLSYIWKSQWYWNSVLKAGNENTRDTLLSLNILKFTWPNNSHPGVQKKFNQGQHTLVASKLWRTRQRGVWVCIHMHLRGIGIV